MVLYTNYFNYIEDAEDIKNCTDFNEVVDYGMPDELAGRRAKCPEKMEGFEQALRASANRLPFRSALWTPSQKQLASSATGGASLFLPAPEPALRVLFRLGRSKKEEPMLCMSSSFSRRRRDLNPRAGHPTYTLSRGASSAS